MAVDAVQAESKRRTARGMLALLLVWGLLVGALSGVADVAATAQAPDEASDDGHLPLAAALLADLADGRTSLPLRPTAIGDGRAVFSAGGDDSDGERELYVTDGTPQGTGLVANLRDGESSFPSEFAQLEHGVAVFQAQGDASDGERELYLTDATAEGTGLLADLRADDGSDPENFTLLDDGLMVFSAEGDASDGERELYATDGTPEGTGLVVDLRDGDNALPLSPNLTALGDGRALFAADGDASDNNRELYVTDGTESGTGLVADLRAGGSSFPRNFTALGDGRAVFSAGGDDSDGERELYLTDGTEEGTELLADLRAGGSSDPGGIVALGDGRAVFVAAGDDSDGERELYVTDGTTDGTGLVVNLREGDDAFLVGGGHARMGLDDGRMVFTARGDASDGENELYVTDGTPEGTGLVANLRDGANSSARTFLVLEPGLAIFGAFGDASDGERELYVTDGTPEGTGLVANLRDGDDSLPFLSVPKAALGDGRAIVRAEGDASNSFEELYLVGPVPSPPQVTVVPGDAALEASWEPLPDATPVDAYTVVVDPEDGDAIELDLEADTTEATVEGLTNEVAHTVVVTATSLLGQGVGSDPVTVTPSVAPDPSAGMDRVAGAHRFDTAARLSAQAYPDGTDVAYVATGLDFPDALAGGVSAALDDAPVLLVTTSTVPDVTAAELERLDLERIVVLGGEGAVDTEAEAALGAYADTVERLAGPTRFATAAEVTAAAFPDGADVAYVATGVDFPDALAAVAAAAWAPGPLLLATDSELTAPTEDELVRLAPDRIVLLGGSAALGDGVAEAAEAYAGSVERLDGATRFATAASIALEAFPGGADHAFVATGADFPDALAAGAVAGARGAPVLLATFDDPTGPTLDALDQLGVTTTTLLGGTAALSEDVEAQLGEALSN